MISIFVNESTWHFFSVSFSILKNRISRHVQKWGKGSNVFVWLILINTICICCWCCICICCICWICWICWICCICCICVFVVFVVCVFVFVFVFVLYLLLLLLLLSSSSSLLLLLSLLLMEHGSFNHSSWFFGLSLQLTTWIHETATFYFLLFAMPYVLSKIWHCSILTTTSLLGKH